MSRPRNKQVKKQKQNQQGKGRPTNAKQDQNKEKVTSSKVPEGKGSEAGAGTESKDTSSVAEGNDGRNDPAWYGNDAQLVIDSASIPFSKPFGSPLYLDNVNAQTETNPIKIRNEGHASPGICVLDVIPSYGTSWDRLSPLNVAATAVYTQVRYVNNGRKNYDPADIMIYLAAIAELYSYLNWMRRIYSAAFVYSQQNKYLGKALLKAMNVNPDSVLNNLANFRYGINVLTNKIASYAVPADLAIFYRRAFQFSAVYKEHEIDSVKDQLYMFNPVSFYKFRLDQYKKGMLDICLVTAGSSDPSKSAWVNSDPGLNYDEILALGNILLENITGDEDFGLISGDILKAFNNNILTLSELPEEYDLEVKYDPLVLAQMENAVVVNLYGTYSPDRNPSRVTTEVYSYTENGVMKYANFGCVYQKDDGNLISLFAQTNWLANNALNDDAVFFGKLINLHSDLVDPAAVIEANQLKVSLMNANKAPVIPTSGEHLLNVGASFVGLVNIYYYDYDAANPDPDKQGWLLRYWHPRQCVRWTDVAGSDSVKLMKMAANFKYLPKIISYTLDSSTNKAITAEVLSNIDNVAELTDDTLDQILEVSLLSLFYVPGVAKYVNRLAK